MQDLAQGNVDVTQTRNAASTTVRKVDTPFPCATNSEMQNLEITEYTRARVYNGATEFVDYIYDPSATTGLVSNTGSGFWVIVGGSYPVQNNQTGTTYTLLASDNGKLLTFNNAGAITVTVPAGLGDEFECDMIQLGAGAFTLSPSSTTVNSRGALLSSNGQHARCKLQAYNTDIFNFSGDRA